MPADAGGFRYVDQGRARVVQEGGGHPFARKHEVGPAVAVEVRPQRVRQHTDMLEFRAPFAGDVEDGVGVVFEEIALGGRRIGAGYNAAADEEVQVPVPVDIHGAYAAAVGEHLWKVGKAGRKMALTVVEVEDVLCRGLAGLQLVAAADDIEVGVAVAVGVKKQRSHVFARVTIVYRDTAQVQRENAFCVLQEEDALVSDGGADVEVFVTVVVDIPHGDAGTILTELVRDGGLDVVVDDVFFFVFETDTILSGDVVEQGVCRRRTGRGVIAGGVAMADGEGFIGSDIGQELCPAVGPSYTQGVQGCDRAETEMGPVVVGGHITPGGLVLVELLFAAIVVDTDGGADAVAVGVFAAQDNGKPVGGGTGCPRPGGAPRPRAIQCILVDKGVVVDVVDDQVEVAVVVEVRIGGAVGERGMGEPPVTAGVGKLITAFASGGVPGKPS